MSRSYACNQFERNYKPVALCNWEVPADRVFTVKPTSTTPPKKTEFIVSDNGHLIGRGQHAQNAPIGSAPARLLHPLGSWPLWAAWHTQGKRLARWVLEPAAPKAADIHRPRPFRPDLAEMLRREMGGIFTEPYLFLGGDELSVSCFDNSPSVVRNERREWSCTRQTCRSE